MNQRQAKVCACIASANAIFEKLSAGIEWEDHDLNYEETMKIEDGMRELAYELEARYMKSRYSFPERDE